MSFKNEQFLDLFFKTDLSYFYGCLSTLESKTYEIMIDKYLKLNPSAKEFAIFFSYFNRNYITIPKYNFGMSWNLGNSATWAIDPMSVNEIGCIHTCQGLEFDYVGVIIGDDLRYEDGHIVTDYTKRAKTDQSLKGINKYMRGIFC